MKVIVSLVGEYTVFHDTAEADSGTGYRRALLVGNRCSAGL